MEEGVLKEQSEPGRRQEGIVIIKDRYCRRLGAELRARCRKLEVEMGRLRGTKNEGRICKLCGEGIEDESQFFKHTCKAGDT